MTFAFPTRQLRRCCSNAVPNFRLSSSSSLARLTGKIAVVTASTEGIGFGIARRLAQEGAHVVLSSRKESNVKEAVETLKSENLSVSGMVCHVSKSDHRTQLIQKTVQEHGGLDILVNNAACNPHFGHMLEVSEDAWDKLFDTNVKAGFMMSKEAFPHMKKRGGGSIVFVSSLAGYNPFQHIAPYSVTKTALFGLTKALAVSLVDDNIRVNAIAPGVIQTRFAGMLTQSDPEDIGIPMKRFGKPEDCAGTVAYLVSEDAAYVTGETIVIAGGMAGHL